MKKDTQQKRSPLPEKKTAFLSGISLNFRPFVVRYCFSKRHNHKDDCANFYGLLRKAELYIFSHFLKIVLYTNWGEIISEVILLYLSEDRLGFLCASDK